MHRPSTHLLTLTIILAITSSVGYATTWDFAADLSFAQNPNGAWQYGWSSAVGGAMSPYDTVINAASGVPEWRSSAAMYGALMKNVTSGTVDANYGSQYFEVGMAGLHPGEGGQLCMTRWTAPSTALVTISAKFTGQSFSGGGTTTDVHVLKNGMSVFDGVVNGFAGRAVSGLSDAFGSSPVQEFEGTLAVSAADTIDFAVGFGNGTYAYDITGLAASITSRDDIGLVKGTVSAGINGNPVLPSAVVRTTDGSASTVTASDGSYSLVLPLGSRTLEAVSAGLKSAQVQLNVQGGAVVTHDFSLAADYGPTYFVSPSGNDNADGRTPATAWRTIANGDARGLLKPGDTVIIAEGTYPQADFWGVALENCSGTSSAPIVYRAAGQVLIDQTSIPKPMATSFGFRILVSHIEIRGFEIVGCQWGVYFSTGTQGNTVAECILRDMIPGDPNAADWHNWCAGVLCSSSSDNLIHHNLIHSIGAQGGSVASCVLTTGSSQNTRIYSNTFANAWSGVHGSSNAGVAGAHDVKNNIITGMWEHGIGNGESTGCTSSHNLFYDNAADYGDSASAGGGDTNADPQFTTEGNYHLQSTSPAVDQGIDAGFPFFGSAPDIGAFEYLPTIAGLIGGLKSQPNGALVQVSEPKVVTAGFLTFSDGSLYVEEPDRASGIKLVPDQGLPPVQLDDRVTFSGRMGTDANGERVIYVSTINSQASGAGLRPLGISGKSILAVKGLKPSGLLVRMWGWVTHRADDASCIYVDDGSSVQDGSGHKGVRVQLSGHVLPLTALPGKDQFVCVTGLLGVFTDGAASGPVIRPRGDSDLTPVAATLDEMTKRRRWVSDNLSEDATGVPFSFTYDGQGSDALLGSWSRTCSERDLDSHRTERTITHTDPATGLQVKCVSVEYDDYPTVEWTVYLKNTGTTDTPIIEDLQGLDAAFATGSGSSPVLHYNVGSPASPSDYQPLDETLALGSTRQIGASGGRPSESYLPFFNLELAGGGVIVAVGWPGQWSAKVATGSSEVGVVAGQELTHFRLHPGEEVRTPLSVLQFWNGNRVRSQNVWRRWMMAYNVPRPGGQLPAPRFAPTAFNQYNGNTTTDIELYYMNRYLAANIQMDLWWIDAGWYPCGGSWQNTGTWEVDTARYPNGLKTIFDYAHSKGMKSIVWFEPERVAGGTWLTLNHPEWILGGSGGGLLNLGNPDALNWLINHVDSLMTAQGIDDYRQDFNMAPLGYWRGNDAVDRQGITEIYHVMGYLAYWDELRRRHPNMLIDSCASGGRRNDLETLRRAVPLWRSDYAFEPTGIQCHTYGVSSWMPFTGGGNQNTDSYTFRSNMNPSITATYDMNNQGIDMVQLRNMLNQWRALAPNYTGDYYPLTPYSQAADVWMAWQFDRPDAGEGIVQAFRRPSCASPSIVLKLGGLEPNASYRLTNIDGGTPTVKTGLYLMNTGLTVTITSAPAAAVIKYQKQ